MIAVQTNEYLHIVDMELSEFLESVAKDGMNSSAIHAKIAANVSSNKYLYTINSVVPEIKWKFCQVGDQFQSTFKPITSLDDLHFFIGPDGKQYANADAYHVALGKGETVGDPFNPELPHPEEVSLEDSSKKTDSKIPNPEETMKEVPLEQPSKEEKVEPVVGAFEDEQVEEDVASKEQEEAKETSILEEKVETIPVTDEQRKIARVLDKTLAMGISLKGKTKKMLQAIKNYVHAHQDEMDENLCSALNISKESTASFQTDYQVKNALGESNSLLDSALVFPVYSTVAMRKTPSNVAALEKSLVGSVFVRTCLMGTDGEHFQGYYQQYTITASDIEDAKTWLKQNGTDFRKVRQLEDRVKAYQKALDDIYMHKKGDITLGGGAEIEEDIASHLEKLSSRYDVPDIDHWDVYHTVLVDARTTSLEEQLEEISRTPIDKSDKVEETKNAEESSISVESPDIEALSAPVINPEIIEEKEKTPQEIVDDESSLEEDIPVPPSLTEVPVRGEQEEYLDERFLGALRDAFKEDYEELEIPEVEETPKEEEEEPLIAEPAPLKEAKPIEEPKAVEEVKSTEEPKTIEELKPIRRASLFGLANKVRNLRVVDRQKKEEITKKETKETETQKKEEQQPSWSSENKEIYELIYGSMEPEEEKGPRIR